MTKSLPDPLSPFVWRNLSTCWDYSYNSVNITLSQDDKDSFDVYISPFSLNEWTLQPSKYRWRVADTIIFINMRLFDNPRHPGSHTVNMVFVKSGPINLSINIGKLKCLFNNFHLLRTLSEIKKSDFATFNTKGVMFP